MPVAMEFTGRIETIRQSATLMRQLLQDQQVVVCFGQRSLLAFFLAGHLERDQVAGAFTTADEALACLTAMPVTMLICSDQLEQGCGLELVLTAKERYPTLRTLLLLTRPQRAARLRAVIECGCDGLLLDATIGMGAAISTVQTVAQGAPWSIARSSTCCAMPAGEARCTTICRRSAAANGRCSPCWPGAKTTARSPGTW